MRSGRNFDRDLVIEGLANNNRGGGTLAAATNNLNEAQLNVSHEDIMRDLRPLGRLENVIGVGYQQTGGGKGKEKYPKEILQTNWFQGPLS